MTRIRQLPVPALFPEEGPVRLLLYGEAPGPRGADQSGIPFWGDRAGVQVYRALAAAGMAEVPEAAFKDWDGARFRELDLRPVLRGAALSNAYPVCPSSDGQKFRAPTNPELRNPDNLARIHGELHRAAGRSEGWLRVVTLGKRAQWALTQIREVPPFELFCLPHPSAQGLLQAAPDKGKGLRLRDLQAAWERDLALILQA
nr:uracil-DNA glycosylase family protein [uncultured Holophaga sp.]